MVTLLLLLDLWSSLRYGRAPDMTPVSFHTANLLAVQLDVELNTIDRCLRDALLPPMPPKIASRAILLLVVDLQELTLKKQYVNGINHD